MFSVREESSDIRSIKSARRMKNIITEKKKSDKNDESEAGSTFFSLSFRGFAARYKRKPVIKGESIERMYGNAEIIINVGISIIIISRQSDLIVFNFKKSPQIKNRKSITLPILRR